MSGCSAQRRASDVLASATAITSASSRLAIVARVRPVVPTDRAGADSDDPAVFANGQQLVFADTAGKERLFMFDRCLASVDNQEAMYAAVRQRIFPDILEGRSACVLCYGQTGSGKTYSMYGDCGWRNSQDAGIVFRVFDELFNTATNGKATVSLQVVEVYCERVYDLLNGRQSVDVVMMPGSNSFNAAARWVEIPSLSAVGHTLRHAGRARTIGSHNANQKSSRAHTLFTLRVAVTDSNSTRRATLCLADLAGSERQGSTETMGRAMVEAAHINQSLSTLGICLRALAGKKDAVAFRQSRLTMLLHKTLTAGVCTMIIALSPVVEMYDESLATANFAHGVRHLCTAVQHDVVFMEKNEEEAGSILEATDMDSFNARSSMRLERWAELLNISPALAERLVVPRSITEHPGNQIGPSDAGLVLASADGSSWLHGNMFFQVVEGVTVLVTGKLPVVVEGGEEKDHSSPPSSPSALSQSPDLLVRTIGGAGGPSPRQVVFLYLRGEGVDENHLHLWRDSDGLLRLRYACREATRVAVNSVTLPSDEASMPPVILKHNDCITIGALHSLVVQYGHNFAPVSSSVAPSQGLLISAVAVEKHRLAFDRNEVVPSEHDDCERFVRAPPSMIVRPINELVRRLTIIAQTNNLAPEGLVFHPSLASDGETLSVVIQRGGLERLIWSWDRFDAVRFQSLDKDGRLAPRFWASIPALRPTLLGRACLWLHPLLYGHSIETTKVSLTHDGGRSTGHRRIQVGHVRLSVEIALGAGGARSPPLSLLDTGEWQIIVRLQELALLTSTCDNDDNEPIPRLALVYHIGGSVPAVHRHLAHLEDQRDGTQREKCPAYERARGPAYYRFTGEGTHVHMFTTPSPADVAWLRGGKLAMEIWDVTAETTSLSPRLWAVRDTESKNEHHHDDGELFAPISIDPRLLRLFL